MPQIEIKTQTLDNGRLLIVQIENVLKRDKLPKAYYAHVPYMYPEFDSLFINYIGGIEYVSVGKTYSHDDWKRVVGYIEICEKKLTAIKQMQNKQGLYSATELQRVAEYLRNLYDDDFEKSFEHAQNILNLIKDGK